MDNNKKPAQSPPAAAPKPAAAAAETTGPQILDAEGKSVAPQTLAARNENEGSKRAVKPPAEAEKAAWGKKVKGARKGALFAIIFLIFLVIAGGVTTFYILKKRADALKQQASLTVVDKQTLTDDDLKKLASTVVKLGANGQILNIGADSVFNGAVSVDKDLNLNGSLSTSGKSNFSDISVSGVANLNSLNLTAANLSSGLTVKGPANLQGTTTVSSLLNVLGNLTVAGNASVGGNLTAGSITTGALFYSGHFTTSSSGELSASAGSGVGGGGTVSVGGNDVTGTVQTGRGVGAPAGDLATVRFAATYKKIPKVTISLVDPGGSLALTEATFPKYYLKNVTLTGFTISTFTPLGASGNPYTSGCSVVAGVGTQCPSATYIFNYIVAE